VPRDATRAMLIWGVAPDNLPFTCSAISSSSTEHSANYGLIAGRGEFSLFAGRAEGAETTRGAQKAQAGELSGRSYSRV